MTAAASMETLLLGAYDAAVAACDPEGAVASQVTVDAEGIVIGGTRFDGAAPNDIAVVAMGKAASAMVRGVVSVLGDVRGIAVSNHVEDCPVPMMIGSHPVPDENSLACGERVLSFARSLSPEDLVVYLVSGGGSSIAVAPCPTVSIRDLQHLNRELLTAGIPIDAMNEIRASVSRIKGGRLAAACPSKRSVTLVLSDVVGAGPSHVASGPSIGAGMGARASDVIEQYGLAAALPESVLEAVARTQPLSSITPMPVAVVGSSAVAAEAAASFLLSRGAPSSIVTTELQGEARDAAHTLLNEADPGVVTIAAGETTVTVVGDGLGGRNQEGALAAAIEIAGTDTVFLASGTDGIDGPTTAAGALVDGSTMAMASERHIDLKGSLARNDSHTALAALGAVIVRGDTGTNVGDVWMIAKGVRQHSQEG